MSIKKFNKKYSTPRHMWRGERINSEAEIINQYGLKNHKEIWKVLFKLSRWRELARRLIINNDSKGTDELLNPLTNISCLKERTLESVFEISPNDIFERRLQTVVFRKGLAGTIKQARHLIVHRHITIDNKVVNAPGHIVSSNDESRITCGLTFVNPKTVETPTREGGVKETFVYRRRQERMKPRRKHIKRENSRKQFDGSRKQSNKQHKN